MKYALFLISILLMKVSKGILQESSLPTNLKVAFIGDLGLSENARSVLNLISQEGANFTIISGDLSYDEESFTGHETFMEMVNDELGIYHPVFVTVGNHDTDNINGRGTKLDFWTDPDQGWARRFSERLEFQNLDHVCETKSGSYFGYDTVCHHEGLLFILSSHGTDIEDDDDRGVDDDHLLQFLEEQLYTYDATWKFCVYHKVQALFQVGHKSDETGYEIYERCRDSGAIAITSHEHSYSRTFPMLKYSANPAHLTGANTGLGKTSSDPIIISRGHNLNILTGTGGGPFLESDENPNDKPWFASTKTDTYGATFCDFFRSDGEERATCYFQEVGESTPHDKYHLKSALGEDLCEAQKELEFDLVFVLEDAESIDRDKSSQLQDFAVMVSGGFTIGLDWTRVGVVEFSVNPNVVIQPDKYDDAYELVTAIHDLEKGGANLTRISAGITGAMGVDGLRSNSRKVMVIITDLAYRNEDSDDEDQDAREAATQAVQEGWVVFVIGIGLGVKRELLKQLVAKDEHAMFIETFNDLYMEVDSLSSNICDAVRDEDLHDDTVINDSPADGDCADDSSYVNPWGDCMAYELPENNQYCRNDEDSDGVRAYDACPAACGACDGNELLGIGQRRRRHRPTPTEKSIQYQAIKRRRRSTKKFKKFRECAQGEQQITVDTENSRAGCTDGFECLTIFRFTPITPVYEHQNISFIYKQIDPEGNEGSRLEVELCKIRECPLTIPFDITYVNYFDEADQSGTYTTRITGQVPGLVCIEGAIEYTRPVDAVDCGEPQVCDAREHEWLLGHRVLTTLVYSPEECCCMCNDLEECLGWSFDLKIADRGHEELGKAACILFDTVDEIEPNRGWIRGRKSRSDVAENNKRPQHRRSNQ